MKDLGPVKTYETLHREYRQARALVEAYEAERISLFDMILDLAAPLEAMVASKNIESHSPEVQEEVHEVVANLHALFDYLHRRNQGDETATPPMLGTRRLQQTESTDETFS